MREWFRTEWCMREWFRRFNKEWFRRFSHWDYLDTLGRAPSHTLPLAPSPSLSLSPSHTLTLSPSHTLSLSHSLSPSWQGMGEEPPCCAQVTCLDFQGGRAESLQDHFTRWSTRVSPPRNGRNCTT